MKRVIKFRGKSLKTGEWFFGNLYDQDTHGRTHICSTRGGCLCIDPETVGQYTGLHDRVGNEIYEGDIVELAFPNGRTDVEYVSFNEGRFVSIDPHKPYRKDALYLYLDCARVIGNIHDTPEILKSISK